MKITIVIEDGKVETTTQTVDSSPEAPNDGNEDLGSLTDAGAAPGSMQNEELVLAETEMLPAGLEPDYSAPAVINPDEDEGVDDIDDAGGPPVITEE